MNKEKLTAGWKYGWPWGLFMFVWMEVVPLFKKEAAFDPLLLLAGLVFWIIGSLLIGLWVSYLLRKK